MNIKDYIKNKKRPTNPEEAINTYSKMSEEELMQELFSVGACSKSGTTPEQLDEFYKKVESFLTAEQKEKMKNLIMQLKMS